MTHIFTAALVVILTMLSGQTLAAPPPNEDLAIPIVSPGTEYAIDAAGVDNILRTRAGELPIIKRVRAFERGEEVPVVMPLPMNIQVAAHDPLTGIITAYGSLGGGDYIEEIRTIVSGGAMFAIVDRYPDGDEDRVGRSTPGFLHDGDDATAQLSITKAATTVSVILPVIKSIGGKTISSTGVDDGKASIFTSCNGTKYAYKWNGWTALNDRKGVLTWDINGENFGDKVGTVTLDNRELALFNSKSWTKTRVTVDPVHSGQRLAQSSKLKLTTAARNSSTYIVSVIPAIKARLLDQCTYFTALRRLDMGKSLPGSNGAYDGFSTITASYEPKVGHVFKLGVNTHQLIITAVSLDTSAPAGVKRWNITFDDQNFDCKQGLRSWKSGFAVKSGKVIEYPRIKAETTSTQLTEYWP